MTSPSKRPKYLAEAVGSFCLVFAGTGAIVVDDVTGGKVTALGISLVFGLIVLAMVYTLGHVSGAHMNPAVTLGFYVSGRFPAREILPYIAAQLAGAILASAVLRVTFAGSATSWGMTVPSGTWPQAFIMEFFLTAMLVLVIMAVATDDRAQGTMAGVALGAVICLEAILGGPVSGASMNPARSFAPALMALNFESHWLYWLAPMLGAVAGARVYAAIRSAPSCPP